MSHFQACCTCATLLTDTKVPFDTETEKPICLDRKLDCCERTICATCQYNNPRFRFYCPFCQISSEPSALPSEGLRLPPSYAETAFQKNNQLPPAYDAIITNAQDVVHFLAPTDTMHSLSLAYCVPANVLRQYNSVFQDSLLAGRKFIQIPHTHYQGPSLSSPPDPLEEERKNKVRRWMVATKCADYDVAVLYLKGSNYDLEAAIEAFKADELWEKTHPLDKGKGKGKSNQSSRKIGSFGLAGQLS